VGVESDLKGVCEDYLSQLHDFRCEKKASVIKYETLLADANSLQQDLCSMELQDKEAQELACQQQLSAAGHVSDMESQHIEQIAEHVHEQERLKLLLVESTTNFTSLSEKYTYTLSSRTEEVASVAHSFKTKLACVKEECGNLRWGFSAC
jgi:hypothetical protein